MMKVYIWFDADTIITSDRLLKVGENQPDCSMSGRTETRYPQLAYIQAQKDSELILTWASECRRKILLFKKSHAS